eukprot:scaffold283344_cov82-Attheya_sp.AAC.1
MAINKGNATLKLVLIVCALLSTQQFYLLLFSDAVFFDVRADLPKTVDTAVAGGSNQSQGAVDSIVSSSDHGVEDLKAFDLVASRKNIEGPLFHLLHTSGDHNFMINNMRVVESVFYHHPDANVKIHVPEDKPINKTRFEPLLELGYHVGVESYELVSLINEYMATEDSSSIMDKNATRRWIQRIPEFSNLKYWHMDVSNLSRLLFIYMQGGVYIDTDIILVKPLYNLTKNFIVWQWVRRRYANNAVLRFDQGNEFIGNAISAFFVRSNTSTAQWGINGPTLVSETLNKHYAECAFGKAYHPAASNISEPQSCPVSVLPKETFFPILYRLQAQKEMLDEKLFPKLKRDILKKSYGVHHFKYWNNGHFPNGTLIHWLMKSFCIVCEEIPVQAGNATLTT